MADFPLFFAFALICSGRIVGPEHLFFPPLTRLPRKGVRWELGGLMRLKMCPGGESSGCKLIGQSSFVISEIFS
ncbi:hypothetical protein DFP73DRAFT_316428 [Morchella snyderi]|nr:hypothetical protein DFP73DRAFT_316428 [Morchella snyderi]